MLARLGRRIGTWELRSGDWFRHVVEAYLESREERRQRVAVAAVADEERVAQTNALIRRAAAVMAASGAGSGASWTAASTAAANTQGVAGIVTIPLAGLVSGLELAFRSLTQIRLTCDIAELYGLRVRPEHRDAVMRLYALALGLVEHDEHAEKDLGRGVIEHVARMDIHEMGKVVGAKLAGDALIRSVVPYVGVAMAALGNAWQTVKLGRTLRSYLIYRCELLERVHEIERRSPRSVEPLVHGLWSVLTATGTVDAAGAALLADLVSGRPHDARQAMLEGFVPGNEDWLHRLRETTDDETRALVMHALTVAAAADAEAEPAEIAILQRAAEALQRPFRAEDLAVLAHQVERMGRVAAPSPA